MTGRPVTDAKRKTADFRRRWCSHGNKGEKSPRQRGQATRSADLVKRACATACACTVDRWGHVHDTSAEFRLQIPSGSPPACGFATTSAHRSLQPKTRRLQAPSVRYSPSVRRISWQRALVGLVVTLAALVAAGELPWRWG